MTSGGARIAGRGKKIGRPKDPNKGKAVQFYLRPEAIKKLMKLAKDEFEGNRSAAVEALIMERAR